MANYIEEDSSEAELLSEDSSNDVEELKQDLVLAKQEVKDAVAVLQAQISIIRIGELERENDSVGSDYHVEAEESPECLGGGDDASDWAFGVDVSGNKVTVQEGPIYIQGMQRVDVAKITDATITGEYVWPTVQIPIASVASASIIYPNAIPAPDTTNVYYPLVRLKCTNWSGAQDKYDFDGAGHILHRGLVPLSNPLTYQ